MSVELISYNDRDFSEYNLSIETAYVYYSIDDFIAYCRRLFLGLHDYLENQIDLLTLIEDELDNTYLGELGDIFEIRKHEKIFRTNIIPPTFEDLGSLYLWFKVFVDNLETLVDAALIK